MGGKTPPLIVFHSAAFVIGRSQEFFNATFAPFALTRRDDQADKRKHGAGKDTRRVDCLVVFTRPVTGVKHMTERDPATIYFQNSLREKKNTWSRNANAMVLYAALESDLDRMTRAAIFFSHITTHRREV